MAPPEPGRDGNGRKRNACEKKKPTLTVTFDLDLHRLAHFLNPASSPQISCDHLERRACVNQLKAEQLRDGGAPPRKPCAFSPRIGTRHAAACGSAWMASETAAHPAATSGLQLQHGEEAEEEEEEGDEKEEEEEKD